MDSCKRGHPRTPENTYIHPTDQRKNYCRVCLKISRRKSRGTDRVALTVGTRGGGPRVLTQRELDALRAAVACGGCGARRVGRAGKPTSISHASGCAVRTAHPDAWLIDEQEEQLRARRAGWDKRKKTDAA